MKKSFITFGLLLPLFIIIVILTYINTQKQPISNPNTQNTASINPEVSQQPYPEDRFSSTTTFKIFDDPDADFTMEYPATWGWRKLDLSDYSLRTSSTEGWVFTYNGREVAHMIQNVTQEALRPFPHLITRVFSTNDPNTDVALDYYFYCPEDFVLENTYGPNRCIDSISPLSLVHTAQIMWWPGEQLKQGGELNSMYREIMGRDHIIVFGDIGDANIRNISKLPGFFPTVEYMASSIKIKQ